MKAYLFILIIRILNCLPQIINNCEQMDINTNTCAKCQDKYFPLFNNLFCIPCDDKDYGQIGCKGNCDSSNFENERIVSCAQNECKEGYYGINGFCLNCGIGSPGCKKCYATEINIDGRLDYEYTCEECLSDEDKMDEFGRCEKCQIDHCLECIFNNSNQECLKCEPDYYISSDKTCK